MAATPVLVVDGNVAEVRARQTAMVGYDGSTGYARVLMSSFDGPLGPGRRRGPEDA